MTIPLNNHPEVQPMRAVSLEHLLRYMGLRPCAQTIQRIFTHQSLNAETNNSRLIFYGMYGFKGLVAGWIEQHIAGTGTQLQHLLGNATGDKHLAYLYKQWQLHIAVRPAASPVAPHLYTFALLGFIAQNASTVAVQKLIYRFFILPHDHLLPGRHIIEKDPLQQLQHLPAQQQRPRPRLRYTALPDGLHQFEACSGAVVLAMHASASYKYARKKAILLALKSVVCQTNQNLLMHPAYKEMLQTIEEKQATTTDDERKARIEAWQKKQDLRKMEKANEKEKARQKAWEADRKRRLAKQDLKEKRKKKESIYRIYTAEEIANMTASKRRNLEDRGIIPKRG